MEKNTRTKLTMDQKLRVLAYIARGDTVSQVAAHILEDFNIKITESALYKIKQANRETISKIQERLADSAAADLESLIRKSRVQLAKKLNKVDRDATEIEELDQQYREGTLSKEDYQRKKAGLLDVSINELAALSSKLVNQQAKIPRPDQPEGPAALPSGTTPPANALPQGDQTPAQLEAMLRAIQSGNTVELTRIRFTPGGAA